MSLVRLTGVTKYFGGLQVLASVTAAMHAGEKIGLIGPNGAGKTTLLRLIAGLEQPDEGDIVLAARAQVGFLRQGINFDEQCSLWEYAQQANSGCVRLGERLRQLEETMADPVVYQDEDRLADVLAEYGRVRSSFELVDGYSSDAAIRATLFGLGFVEVDLGRPFQVLSGGQKARAALGRLLCQAPDLLLLDEPTNHLDMAATEWLEKYLSEYKGSLIVVSHDRAFLDAVVNNIWELEEGQLLAYRGNYSVSRAVRDERRARATKEYLAQQSEIADLKEYISRYKAGNRATMAKSRERALARLVPVERPTSEAERMRIRLAAGPRSGREVIFVDGVTKTFGQQEVLREVELLVCRGERIGIVGANGAGKSTLIKIIADRMPPSLGRVHYGKSVAMGYFSQEQHDLKPHNTVMEELLSVADMTLFEARSHLALFMFRGEDVDKEVSTLSGGERNRLTLAKLVLCEANLLLLDEPTNHLDIPSKEAVEAALAGYQGTLIFVSHDRFFLSRLAQRIWSVADGTVEDFPGGYQEFRARELDPKPSESKDARPKIDTVVTARRAAERALRKAQTQLQEIEEAIAVAEERKKGLEMALSDTAVYLDPERVKKTTQAHRETVAALESLYRRWEDQAILVDEYATSVN